jgi:NTP pyrophosphatase (non-canonical NTP hydrolase)
MNENIEERPEDAARRFAQEALSWKTMAENVNQANRELCNRSLNTLQVKMQKWRRAAYPDTATVELQALGVAEEVGELCHAVLKFKQGIRGYDYNKTREEVEDAIGDIIIYAMGVADRFDINMEDALVKTVDHVISRNITQGSDMGKGRPDDAGHATQIPGMDAYEGRLDDAADVARQLSTDGPDFIAHRDGSMHAKGVDYAGHVPIHHTERGRLTDAERNTPTHGTITGRLPQNLTEKEKAIARQAIAAMKDKDIPGYPIDVSRVNDDDQPTLFHGDTI